MKEFIVYLDHTTRLQVPILANTEEEAAMMLRDIYLGSNLLENWPIASKGSKVICGDIKLALPAVRIDSDLLCDDCRSAYTEEDDEGEEIDLLAMLTNVRDEVEAALEHLDGAIFDLLPEDE